MKFSSFR
jgi:all-trans-retinol dehydrogenase (NAD+)